MEMKMLVMMVGGDDGDEDGGADGDVFPECDVKF